MGSFLDSNGRTVSKMIETAVFAVLFLGCRVAAGPHQRHRAENKIEKVALRTARYEWVAIPFYDSNGNVFRHKCLK
eukprot:SAG22_NODE_201_length_15391_cov_7.662176_9_plen_76_part_00